MTKTWKISVLILMLPPVLAFMADQGMGDKSLLEMKQELGVPLPEHFRGDADASVVEMGRQLIHEGRASLPEGNSNYISRFYVCTSCHNSVREDADLSTVRPEERLTYAEMHDIPYLQGSTLWGIVNRVEWYNGDYVKKYGDLVVEANKSLEGSIQLCAQECSQGRMLEEWEMEAILAYLSTLEVMLSDLDLSKNELVFLSDDDIPSTERLALLDERFLSRSPATFVEPPGDKQEGYPPSGDSSRGKLIYERSCQHCHKEDGVSDLILDDAKKTFKWLRNNITDESRYSIYEIIRKGTYAEYGHREYMPLYTAEKMSDQQVEDLRTYIESQAR